MLVDDEELEPVEISPPVLVKLPYGPEVEVKSPLSPVPMGYPPVVVVEGFRPPGLLPCGWPPKEFWPAGFWPAGYWPAGFSPNAVDEFPPAVEATSVLLAHGSFSCLCSSLRSSLCSLPVEPPFWASSSFLLEDDCP